MNHGLVMTLNEGHGHAPVRTLRTERWLSDAAFELEWPAKWSVSVPRPSVPPPLSAGQTTAALRNPVGLAALVNLAPGKRKPLVIIDDLSRPTPAAQFSIRCFMS